LPTFGSIQPQIQPGETALIWLTTSTDEFWSCFI